MSERQIINRAKKLQALEAQKTELEKQISEVKAEIQAEMQDSEEIQAGGFIIRFATIISSKLDTKALKAAYPFLCEEFNKSTQSRRFTMAQAK